MRNSLRNIFIYAKFILLYHKKISIGNMIPGRPGTIMPSGGVPGSSLAYPVPQSGFSMSSMTPQYLPSSMVYSPPNAAGVPTSIPLVRGQPPTYQRVYVPVQQMPVHPYTSVPVGQLSVTDSTKSVEDQRKLEKERNFQWQQQRLKQFTVAGKKGSLNANTLLNSMFGKQDSKKELLKQHSNERNKNTSEKSLTKISKMNSTMSSPSQPQITKEIRKMPIEVKKMKDKSEVDPKKLENMMLECSSLSGPQKAKGFQKPLVKEISKSSQFNPNTVTFSSSQKAINWNKIHGLENVFSELQPRFPPWCTQELIPPLYKQIEKLVTEDGSHPPSTNLLFPILLSSGLSQKALSDIWELVNITTPGELAKEEMYAALALIAIVQAGHQVSDINILHRLPSCPIPLLQCFQSPSASEMSSPVSPTDPQHSPSTLVADHTSVVNRTVSKPVDTPCTINQRPAYIPVDTTTVSNTSNPPPWNAFGPSDNETSITDDDFDDFKSATPVAVNAPPMTVSGNSSQLSDDAFDDFKQAEHPTNIAPPPVKFEMCKPPSITKHAVPDLMYQDDDRYSVFRELQMSNEIENSPNLMSNDNSPMFSSIGDDNTERKDSVETAQPSATNTNEEEFGDFLDARIEITTTTCIASLDTNQQSFTPDFADFSKLNDLPENNESFKNVMILSHHNVPQISKPKNPVNNTEFGDFGDFQTAKFEVGQEYYFPSIKDNISLTETQSISSLELPSFEAVVQSGDSKSSLSRQGSIPSLDLRCISSEGAVDADDGYGELQSAVTRHSHSPTSSIDTFKSCEDKSPSSSVKSLPFPSSAGLPLTDRYSVIRSEQLKFEDQHLSNWTRCVESCFTILQKATRIFNQMSCSSVCNEVLSTEEGKNYVKNVIEVYRIVCRVNLAAKSYEKTNNKLQRLIEDADKAFNTLAIFLAGSALLPDETSLDFSLGILKSSLDNNEKACGVCLLNVDSRSKAFNKNEDINKLMYGGRQYHSACANLWINYVEPLLPALLLPQLI